jgi:uncharacterized protein (TIGR03437 family)
MLAGTRVLFDGVEARLIYAKNDQVTAIVPPNVAGKPTVEVRVEYLRTAPAIAILPVTASSPGTFGVLNQDFSVNSVNRPAGRGSVVMIYATGLGTNLPVHVSIGGKDTPVLYAGPAPGLVEGVAQVNVRLPEDVASGPVPLFVWAGGRASAAGVMIAVR